MANGSDPPSNWRAAPDPMYAGMGSRPVPDPTELTSALISSAINQLQELLESKIGGQHDSVMARLDAMDKAIQLLQAARDQRPSEADVKTAQLQALHDEKFRTVEERFKTTDTQFRAIDTQFVERDIRGRDATAAATTAINAALQAQKEAAGEQAKSFTLSIDKSEKATGEQIGQLRVLLDASQQTIATQISDLKERATRFESLAVGAATQAGAQRAERTETRGSQNYTLAIVLGAFSFVSLIIAAAGLVIAIAR